MMIPYKHRKNGTLYLLNRITNSTCTKEGWVKTAVYQNAHTGEWFSRPYLDFEIACERTDVCQIAQKSYLTQSNSLPREDVSNPQNS